MSEPTDLTIPYQKYFDLTAAQIAEGYTALEVAGIMMAQAMTIYKNLLSAEEFDEFLHDIIDMQDQVPILTKNNSTLQ